MAPNFLALATTLENLGARRLLAKKVNFVPWVCFVQLSYARNKYSTTCTLSRSSSSVHCMGLKIQIHCIVCKAVPIDFLLNLEARVGVKICEDER